jgi:hypothetical protein
MEIKSKETETTEPPERLNPKNVCYWYEKEGKLNGSQKTKAEKFLEMGCVLETYDPDIFVVKFIEGYNKTNHTVNIVNQTCSCQYNKRLGLECSHIIAVKLYNFMKGWKRKI